ncbi:MAG: hypothetical protein ABGX04_05595 [Myxococcales bacterium]
MPRTPARLIRRPLSIILAMTVLVSVLGCANGEFRFGDPFDRQLTLTESQHRYTVLVRWSQFQKARAFVATEDRDAFMTQMQQLGDARITEYESQPIELDSKKQKATISVTYTLYTTALPYEIKITEEQEWTRSGISNNWNVTSTFDGLRQLAFN